MEAYLYVTHDGSVHEPGTHEQSIRVAVRQLGDERTSPGQRGGCLWFGAPVLLLLGGHRGVVVVGARRVGYAEEGLWQRLGGRPPVLRPQRVVRQPVGAQLALTLRSVQRLGRCSNRPTASLKSLGKMKVRSFYLPPKRNICGIHLRYPCKSGLWDVESCDFMV